VYRGVVRAVVHRISFPDLDRSWPFDPTNVRTLVEICAGPSNEHAEEIFYLTVCTPAALPELLAEQPILVGRHYLLVAEFDPRAVERYLRQAIAKIDGWTWNDVAERIGRLAHWEFEDYGRTPDP
jgi:hypothetical protein